MTEQAADPKPFKRHIIWGRSPEIGERAKTYEFATEAERTAFDLGIEEMDGFAGYQQVENAHCYIDGLGDVVDSASAREQVAEMLDLDVVERWQQHYSTDGRTANARLWGEVATVQYDLATKTGLSPRGVDLITDLREELVEILAEQED